MLVAWVIAAAAAAQQTATADYAGDARALDRIVVQNYAYEDHWPGGVLPDSPTLAAERGAVHDGKSLLHYAEHRIASLADHHAITGSSFGNSWAIIPTYADLWVERRGEAYLIDAVKPGSPAAAAGIVPGDRLDAIGGVPTATAVRGYWQTLGLAITPERADYAARLLTAGRRDRARDLTVAHDGRPRRLMLATLYSAHSDAPAVTVSNESGGRTVIRFNNSCFINFI